MCMRYCYSHCPVFCNLFITVSNLVFILGWRDPPARPPDHWGSNGGLCPTQAGRSEEMAVGGEPTRIAGHLQRLGGNCGQLTRT